MTIHSSTCYRTVKSSWWNPSKNVYFFPCIHYVTFTVQNVFVCVYVQMMILNQIKTKTFSSEAIIPRLWTRLYPQIQSQKQEAFMPAINVKNRGHFWCVGSGRSIGNGRRHFSLLITSHDYDRADSNKCNEEEEKGMKIKVEGVICWLIFPSPTIHFSFVCTHAFWGCFIGHIIIIILCL